MSITKDVKEDIPDSASVDVQSQPVALSRKETLSAYFTIAAAAFGLISDGCEATLYSFACVTNNILSNKTKTIL